MVVAKKKILLHSYFGKQVYIPRNKYNIFDSFPEHNVNEDFVSFFAMVTDGYIHSLGLDSS